VERYLKADQNPPSVLAPVQEEEEEERDEEEKSESLEREE
jgi:hypothetical protein